MKKITWDNPDKMHFESGHKTFDGQTNLITTGNIHANTQEGHFIRPISDTKGWDGPRPRGHFTDWDLSGFDRINPRISRQVRVLAEDQKLILYRFFHHTTTGRKIVHGYVVTTDENKLLKMWVTGPTYKSDLVIAEAKFVTK